MTATLAELGTKKMLVELAVENIIKVCWKIENPDSEMIDCTVKFADGLPTSESEKIDNILKKNGNEPIISMIDAIKEAYPGISEDEAKVTREMKDSAWYAQVGNRGKRNVEIMASNKIKV